MDFILNLCYTGIGLDRTTNNRIRVKLKISKVWFWLFNLLQSDTTVLVHGVSLFQKIFKSWLGGLGDIPEIYLTPYKLSLWHNCVKRLWLRIINEFLSSNLHMGDSKNKIKFFASYGEYCFVCCYAREMWLLKPPLIQYKVMLLTHVLCCQECDTFSLLKCYIF